MNKKNFPMKTVFIKKPRRMVKQFFCRLGTMHSEQKCKNYNNFILSELLRQTFQSVTRLNELL